MTEQHDVESKKRQLTRDGFPAKHGSVRRLMERVDELEKRLAALEDGAHGHCPGSGGESYESNGGTLYMHDADCSSKPA